MNSMNSINIKNILDLIASFNGKIVNECNYKDFDDIKPANDANENSLVFVDSKAKNKDKLIAETQACVVICDYVPDDEAVYQDKCLIVVNNPKLFFAKLVNRQLATFIPQTHPSAVISESAMIAENCYIGAHVVIGENVEIGEGTCIHYNCSIYDNVKIGQNVIIKAGCVIGATSLGFVKDEDGIPVSIPQIGGVVIGDDVEIGANTCIDRGTLQNTVIHKGVKIGGLALVSHNVEIGEYTYIIASTMIAGGVKIGKRCWIATSNILNKITIGDDVTIGYGSVVLKSVPSGVTQMGNPAVDIKQYAQIQYKLKKM